MNDKRTERRFDNILSDLLGLEDQTEYKIKKISKAVDLLQEAIPDIKRYCEDSFNYKDN